MSRIAMLVATDPALTGHVGWSVLGVVATAGNHLVTAQRNGSLCTAGSSFDFTHVRVLSVG